jgi:hypothetical protein
LGGGGGGGSADLWDITGAARPGVACAACAGVKEMNASPAPA